MQNRFSIGEAAKMVDMTSETLRHYDRIGLVKPHEQDPWTHYRYYTQQEIVRLNTIQALRCMELSLKEIKEVLAYDDLEKIIAFLQAAEQSADDKMARLRSAKAKIQRARIDYEKKRHGSVHGGTAFTQSLPQRWLLLSDTLHYTSLDILWNYLSHFYSQIPPAQREAFSFEDAAGVYLHGGQSHLFAICQRYPSAEGLVELPAGGYLCANCPQEEADETIARLTVLAQKQHRVAPAFVVQMVVITGILQWDYQIQIFLGR